MRTGWRMLHADFLLTVYVYSVYYYNVAAQVGEFKKIIMDKKKKFLSFADMLENLKLALKKQKRLIIIFLLTIFLPSIALSIFGVRAIRNERFRLAKQIENEHRRGALFLKNQIESRFKEIEIALQNLVQNPSFSHKGYSSIEESLNYQFKDDQLAELIFLAYKDEEPLFPLFLLVSPKRVPMTLSSQTSLQRERLERAQRLEFSRKDFSKAAVLYEQIFSRSGDKDMQAQMLNNMARCHIKLKKYDKAIQIYTRICEEYPQCVTFSSLPLSLLAEIQIVRCYRSKGAHDRFMTSAFNLYRNILQKHWHLDADQFNIYSSMIKKDISNYLSDYGEGLEKKDYIQKFEGLEEIHGETNLKWQMVEDLRDFILPDLQRKYLQQSTSASNPFRHSRVINQRDYLVIVSPITKGKKGECQGLLGIKIDEDYLLNHEVNRILKNFPFSQEVCLSITAPSGEILSEYGNTSSNDPTVTTYFDGSFPPWKVNFFSVGKGDSGVIGLKKSFYFWTILTILVLLTFGSMFVVRTVVSEMEVLRIKSDFISSVSHEFKTPITSIKALIERLQQGKINTPGKRKEYYSIISKDADKLSCLARNILDYSKVDAGRKQYVFQETDVTQLVQDEIDNFKREKIYTGIEINTQLLQDIPSLDIDREAFSLALNNLLENAVKFSPRRKEILVEVRKEAENIRVDVKDKGMGISSMEIDKIFDKFFRAKSACQQSAGGTGLGLTLVKHVMDAHGGKVLVKSKLGQGSTFSLIFPIRGKKG